MAFKLKTTGRYTCAPCPISIQTKHFFVFPTLFARALSHQFSVVNCSRLRSLVADMPSLLEFVKHGRAHTW